MKDKTTAGILAILGGWAGVHRFYLGQPVLGIVYLLLMFTGISAILGIIDGISILSSADEVFDAKYNRQRTRNGNYPRRKSTAPRRRSAAQNQRQTQAPQRRRAAGAPQRAPSRTTRKNPFFDTGMKKYEDYDMKGAIADFTKGLEINPADVKTHFRLACAYSISENADKAFFHLSKAVENGMKNLDKIQSTDELAYLRIQDQFAEFQKNNYRLAPSVQPPPDIPSLDEDVLLRQLNKLKDLRDKGILSEKEFVREKKKLSR